MKKINNTGSTKVLVIVLGVLLLLVVGGYFLMTMKSKESNVSQEKLQELQEKKQTGPVAQPQKK